MTLYTGRSMAYHDTEPGVGGAPDEGFRRGDKQ